MNIAFFGSSLVSAYWNGAATYYRGLIRALHARGHHITFYEPDAYGRQQHRDIDNPSWAEVVVWEPTESAAHHVMRRAAAADLIVKASGVGVLDDLLEAAIPDLKRPSNTVIFWDVDAPATLDRLAANPADPFHLQVPRYDAVFTYGGGQPVIDAYRAAGARSCVPIYNALDPDTHFPALPDPRFRCDLAFLGNRLPDRERRVDSLFFAAAALLPEKTFLLGGAGWGDKPRTTNVRYIDHVFTADHNALNSTARAVLNISRDSMARFGFSPATRVFEAAGAAACIITDSWPGIELFFEPGREILVAAGVTQLVDYLRTLSPATAARIGEAAYRRVLAHHTYRHRAEQVEALLGSSNLAVGAA